MSETKKQIDDGGAAFPRPYSCVPMEIREPIWEQDGMSLRDWFAGLAMQGMLANECNIRLRPMEGAYEGIGMMPNAAYAVADAMLVARKGATNG